MNWRLAVAIGLGMLATVGVAPSNAQTDGNGFSTAQFHSFTPAAPRTEIPSLRPGWLDQRAKAQSAYREGDFEAARMYLEKAAADGDLVAKWSLGNMYRLGQGVDVDHAKAFAYYESVAQAFSPQEPNLATLQVMVDGLVHVANYLRNGNTEAGIPARPRRAFEIYRLAQTYGHPAAQYRLGEMYFEGHGVMQNREHAIRWFLLAARKRYAPAEAKLGDLYWTGEFLPQNRERALAWYTLARESADPAEFPEIFNRFEGMIKEVSDSERAGAERRAKNMSRTPQ